MPTELFWIEGSWPGRLAIAARPRGGDWLDDEVRGWRRAGLEVIVSLLTRDECADLELSAEAESCKSEGMQFLSFPIDDRGVPTSRKATFDFLKGLENSLQEGKSIAIHCRQGIGRSALITAALLVMSGATAEAALPRVSVARGCPVPETSEQVAWVARFANEFTTPVAGK